MIQSNITFASNIYVVQGENKLSDRKFLSQVVDPAAIREIASKMTRDADGRVKFLLPLHGEIYEYSKPCAYSNGDYTHGVIFENGKPVFVNTCENKECVEFKNCRAAANYRKIIRSERITSENVSDTAEPDDDFEFDIDLPKTPRKKRVQKLRIGKIRNREVIEEIKIDIRINEFKRWSVTGFWRRLSDGTTTWVRPHVRHHEREEVENKEFVKKAIPLRYRLKDYTNFEKFQQILSKRKSRARQGLFSEEVIARDNTYRLKKIKQIDSAERIIKSSLDSKILVNAGPGTGKTHTVIERLKYIDLNEKDVIPDSILVLCFSRSAVKVIRDRLSAAIDGGKISAYAKRFTVMTFDSFATWYLMQVEPDRDLTYNGYDERINMFIYEYERNTKKLNEALSYLIVDEVQDLVGVRAKLVQSLLKNIDCGFLLLGDECQAIYDYQITDENELNAAKLYEWLEKSFDSLEEYELTHDWRHTNYLEEKFAPLRRSMLYQPFNIQKEELLKILKSFDMSDFSAEDVVKCCICEGIRAILSWSNGDAYRQSQEFYLSDAGIKHTILTGARKVCICKELALILSRYTQNTINRRTFMAFADNADIVGETAKSLWQGILFTTDKDDDDDILVDILRRELLYGKRIDDALLAECDADVVISTIHKAKGREFDTVLLNRKGEVDNDDSIKVYYVALTRAKKDLVVRRNRVRSGIRDLRVDRGRYIEVNGINLKRIELGIDGDIDPIGFVSKKLPGMDAQTRQRYIRDAVKIGDNIKIIKYGEEYIIVHEGHFIGRLNKDALPKRFDVNRRYYELNKYTDFAELFVKDVVTIVNNRIDSDIAEPYDKSGFWLGIEFCGYARPREE